MLVVLLAAVCQVILVSVPGENPQMCNFHWSVLRQWVSPTCATPVSGTEQWRVTECADGAGCIAQPPPPPMAIPSPAPSPAPPQPAFTVIAQPGITYLVELSVCGPDNDITRTQAFCRLDQITQTREIPWP